jgi:hypothetical protein
VTSAQVKAQLIANGAAKIRAALVQSINAKAIVAGYMDIHPVVTDSPARDRAQARAWAIMTVNTKNDPLRQALRGIYATLYAFGLNEGKELMARALRSNKGAISARLNHSHAQLLTATIPIDSKFVMDWSAWKPGNEAAALLLDPPGGLAKLLDGIDIKSLVNTTLDQLGTQLADGLRVGATPTQIARSIQDSVTSSSRSLTISLTEGSRAAIEANRQSFVEQGVEQWEWSVNDPEDEDCLENDGEVVDIGEDFPSGDAQPPVHPNCFPAGVLVQSPQVVGAIERWYEGEMVELTTSEGIVLPATPNHPILTPNGWVAAGLLEVGQEVIHYPNFKREALVYPNDDYIPTCIEKVVHAFSRSGSVTTREVPVTAMDFHGDGVGSDSAIILSASFFFDCKSDEKSDSSLVRESPQEQKGFDGLKTSLRIELSHGIVGKFLCLVRKFQPNRKWKHTIRGRLLSLDEPAQDVYADCADTKPSGLRGRIRLIQQSPIFLSIRRLVSFHDSSPCNADLLLYAPPSHAQTLDAAAHSKFHIIPSDHISEGVSDTLGKDLDSYSDNSMATGTHSQKNMISLSFAQSINALAGEVSLDDLGHCRVDVVTAVVRSAFAGHVYNLETVEGWYIANGIVTHNCKCTMILNPVDPSANDQSGDVGFGDGTTEWDGWGDSSAPAGADTSFIDTGAGDGAAAGLMGGGSASAPVTAPTQPAAVPVRVVTPEPERPITPAKPTPTSTVPTTSPKKVVQPKPKTQAPAPPGKPVKAPKIPPVKVDKVPVLPTAQSVSNSVIGNFDIAGINSLGDEAAKLYTARKKGEIKDFGDQYLHAIQEKQGFNALPKLVGKEELKQLISNGWTKTFRGLTGESGVNAKETIAEFKNGVNYSGQGIYGGGSYTSNVFSTALLYAGNKESGVMSLAIAPDAKIISYNEIAKITIEFSYSLEDNPEASSEARWLSRDPGNMAALLGYDVIKYDHSNGEVYYVVLNRGKVAVVK